MVIIIARSCILFIIYVVAEGINRRVCRRCRFLPAPAASTSLRQCTYSATTTITIPRLKDRTWDCNRYCSFNVYNHPKPIFVDLRRGKLNGTNGMKQTPTQNLNVLIYKNAKKKKQPPGNPAPGVIQFFYAHKTDCSGRVRAKTEAKEMSSASFPVRPSNGTFNCTYGNSFTS